MGMIYWLASYPKSGNTWTRAFLTNYWKNADQPADINDFEGGPIASARNLFDEAVGVEASDLTKDEIENLRPRVYQDVAANSKENLYLKVHDAFTYTPGGVPLLPKDVTGGVIYIIRNPLDVVVSFAHHSNRPVEKMIPAMNDPDFAFVNNPRSLQNQLVQKLLTWSGHVLSWVDEPGLNALVIRYEDMHARTEEIFTEVARFAGLEVDAERVRKAIRFSSFDVLQAQEKEHGFGEKMPFSESFFRKGKIGTWREKLSEEQAAQIVAEHGEVMRRFGYLTEDGRIVF
jgi:hypothetical protein